MKRTPLRTKPKRYERMPAHWWELNTRCQVCEPGECEGPLQRHHIVSKQALRRRGLEGRKWDVRNRLVLCEKAHALHTSRLRPLSRSVLPAGAFEFAEECGLGWWLERYYPEEPA